MERKHSKFDALVVSFLIVYVNIKLITQKNKYSVENKLHRQSDVSVGKCNLFSKTSYIFGSDECS